MGKIAFVFSGQGAQYPGMGERIYQVSEAARKVFECSEELRPGTIQQCFRGTKEELSQTIHTQPCLYTVDLAIAEAVKEKGVVPHGVAGFSLGEIAALTFAGIMTQEEGFPLVNHRGRWMEEAGKKHPGAMAAVMKLSADQVEAFAQESGVWPVNYNSPFQTVVAGTRENLPGFKDKVKANGGLVMPLSVSGAFHSPLMKEASCKLEELLRTVEYHKGWCPVYGNVTAKPYPQNPEEGKRLTAQQASSPVQWQKTIETMVAEGYDTFIEVGPGKTLTGLIRKIAPQVRAISVEKAEDLEKEEWNHVKR